MNIAGKTLEGIVIGVSTAATWGFLVYAVTVVRSFFLERRLRRSFTHVGHSFSVEGFGVSLHNETKIPVKVREVAFLIESGGSFVLNYCGKKAAQRRIKASIPGEKKKIEFSTSCPDFESPEVGGAVELDFEMTATWYMSNKATVEPGHRPRGGFAIIEFPTFLGMKRRILVEFERPEDLQKSFDHHVKECHENDFMKQFI